MAKKADIKKIVRDNYGAIAQNAPCASVANTSC